MNIPDHPRTTIPNGLHRHGNGQITFAVLGGSLADLVSIDGRGATA